MTAQAKQFELRLGDLVRVDPHGQALLLGAVDGGGNTFIVAIERDDKIIYTIITQESIIEKYEPRPRLLRIKQASFGADLLAQQATGGTGH